MLEKDCLLYLGPEKFPTRRHELLQKKASKEISIDQAHLVVKDKQQDLTCPTVTELEVSNAFKRRALSFDLVGVCTYDVMAAYHADLLDHLHTLPPPGYSAVSVQQVLRADRAAFMFQSVRMTSLKRNATNQLPLDLQLTAVLGQPNVAFHLLPLSGNSPKAPAAPKSSNPKRRSRTPRRQQAKAVDPISQQALSTKHWKHHRSNAFVGLSTSQMGWRKLPKRHSFVCGAGVFQTPLPARPSLRWSEFHPWLFFRRKADQPDFCYRILRRNCQIDRTFKIFGFS